LFQEWKRTGLPFRKANEACGVADVATRKYLDQGHLWYYPPPEMFLRLQNFANEHGDPAGRPYFSIDGVKPRNSRSVGSHAVEISLPARIHECLGPKRLRGSERFKIDGDSGKAVH